jgi:hypothetical protein
LLKHLENYFECFQLLDWFERAVRRGGQVIVGIEGLVSETASRFSQKHEIQ